MAMKKFLALLMVILFGFTTLAQAQDQGPGQDQAQESAQGPGQDAEPPPTNDPPPIVGRISLIHGNVSTKRGDSGDWNAATLNTPVSIGDTVATGDESRAEVQLDFANVIRLDQNSAATMSNLSNSQIQVQISQGLATFSVLRGNGAAVEIDTPNAAIHPLREGDYRVEVLPDGQTRMTPLGGFADVTTSQGSTRVVSNAMITIRGTENPQYQIAAAASKDQWDKFNQDRDSLILNAQSVQRTSPYYVGTQDLDAYGRWANVPGYNGVWYPNNVPAGWAPYSSGRWVWQPYYGWTWVSYEPWGWAPYHYGRWLYTGGAWGWWPGPVYGYPYYRPIWAPAYVTFFGFGGFGFGVGFGFGSFGWLPLGPGGWFYPWWGRGWWGRGWYGGWGRGWGYGGWGRGPGGWGRVAPLNAKGVSNVREAETNANVRNGISRMSAQDFGKTAVPQQAHNMSASDFKGASAMTKGMPVTPTKASLRSVDHAANASSVRAGASVANQHFSSKAQSAARPASFSQEAAQAQKTANDSRAAYSGSHDQTAASSGRSSEASEHGANTATSASGR
jgi:hypothetical protein